MDPRRGRAMNPLYDPPWPPEVPPLPPRSADAYAHAYAYTYDRHDDDRSFTSASSTFWPPSRDLDRDDIPSLPPLHHTYEHGPDPAAEYNYTTIEEATTAPHFQPVPQTAALQTFHGRPLPDLCLAFTEPESQTLLLSAMHAGTARIYFSLAQQYLTQSEPAFCGLATLVMILNACNIDPHQVWKGNWRWYAETMLSCCRPLQQVEKQGITMAEFLCLARCNGLEAWSRSIDGQGGLTLLDFEHDLATACASDDLFMAVSFGRKALDQTGDGHFSPVAAYARDAVGDAWVLVLDVARFKYPSYWVRLERLFEALCTVDPATGRARGYALLSRAPAAAGTQQQQQQQQPAFVTIALDKNSARQLFSIPGLSAARTVRELKAKAEDLKPFASCIGWVDLSAFGQNPEAVETMQANQRALKSSGWTMQELFYAGLVEYLNNRSGNAGVPPVCRQVIEQMKRSLQQLRGCCDAERACEGTCSSSGAGTGAGGPGLGEYGQHVTVSDLHSGKQQSHMKQQQKKKK